MQRLRDCAVWKYLAVFVAASMVVPYGVISAPATAEAQAQTAFSTASVVVLPIRDTSGVTDTVDAQKATDALALALEASDEFTVTPKRDLQREVSAMGLVEPLAVPEQLRLAQRLQVKKVLSGYIGALAVNQLTGQVRVRLVVELLDVATFEFLDGANVSLTTKAIPGWSGERNQVVNEALREAAEAAVNDMVMSRTPVGTVTSVSDNGRLTVNIGATDGIAPGTEMVVMRPIYQQDLGQVRLVKMGTIAIRDVSNDMAWAAPLKEGRAKVGDRTYALHMNVARVDAHKRTTNIKSTTKLLAGLAALLGIAVMVTGDHTTSPPANVSARLFQQAAGEEAVIRVRVPARSIPLTEQVFAWLFYRREGQANFPLIADYVVDIWPETRLANGTWDDDAATRLDLNFSADYEYLDNSGNQDTVSVDIDYNHPGLLPGGTYYYRVQRVVEPETRAGSGSPITTQISPAQVVANINVNPQEALSQGSKPTNPVTYFTPVTLQAPDNGSQNQSTSSITFSWATTLGANEYVLQVFPEDDPSGVRNPSYQVTQRRDAAGTMSATISGSFTPSSRYYWRVGARRSGEATPLMGSIEGWLFSEMRDYTTAVAPPPPPGSSAADAGAPTRIYRGSSGLGRYGH